MGIEEKDNCFYVAVARDGTEYFSDEPIKKVEDYINNEHNGTKRYDFFVNQWKEGVWGDYYSFLNFSDYGIFYGEDIMYDWLFSLPKGTIEAATGVKLTYKDGAKKIKIEPIQPIGIKWQIQEEL